MNLPKIASRVAILFGGPQYKYFKDIVIEIDKNSLIGDPRLRITGKWLGDPHPYDPMEHHFTEIDAEISFDRGDLVEGEIVVTDVPSGTMEWELPRHKVSEIIAADVADNELLEIITSSEAYKELEKLYQSDPTPGQQDLLDNYPDATVEDYLLHA